ncbi:class I SAM-dependent methyltransferase [Microbacterium sp. WCS2018Hpa-9]|uniref:class I SAM-dependent methyltransferase n=1 Tax=Microbacterium sp. WCS2018Hpa-9 TaxID=3073635 RepID=UPI00288A9D13|nr:class I SAM-dependent methyltransferase [Microbacterium sp. WCS2018Hpa-9]
MKDWAGTGRAYADSYASLCVGTAGTLLGMLGAPAGRSLLDVGSGTGLLTASFSDAGWGATGCEPEPTMREVALREHPAIRVRDGALPSLPFADAEFDSVVANFVLNHVADPLASAGELLRVSADLVAATIWTNSPTWLWREVCDRAALTPTEGERLAPEKDFERTVDGFARMLDDAGWTRPQISEITWTWPADATALWASAEGGVGGPGQFYRALDDTGQRSFRAAFELVCAERSIAGRLPLVHSAAVAVASRG